MVPGFILINGVGLEIINNMKILLTGASGFLGGIIEKELSSYTILTVGRTLGAVRCDLSKGVPELPSVDIVIHAAGKAHSVPKTAVEKQEFFEVNVQGTLNLLTGLKRSDHLPKSFVFISSVAVYGRSSGISITETAALLAEDSYGLSKIEAEKLVIDWCEQNNVICSILRLPLLAGANPPGNLKAMINGIKKGYYFNIAGGRAKKSIVMASDIARIIPKAAATGGIYNLTDRYHPSFSELALLISEQTGKSKPHNLPLWLAGVIAKIGDQLGKYAPVNSDKLSKITSDLTFDDDKATRSLGWNPRPVLSEFMR